MLCHSFKPGKAGAQPTTLLLRQAKFFGEACAAYSNGAELKCFVELGCGAEGQSDPRSCWLIWVPSAALVHNPQCPQAGTSLRPCCRAGPSRHSIELARGDVNVFTVERSEPMLAFARNEARREEVAIQHISGDVRTFALAVRTLPFCHCPSAYCIDTAAVAQHTT